MRREGMDRFGTPWEEWILTHTLQPGPMPPADEYFAREVKTTPEQHELFDKIAKLVGDPRFTSESFVTVPMGVGLWRSVEKGELDHMQGLELDRLHLEALEKWEDVISERRAGFPYPPADKETSLQLELFDETVRLIGDPRFAATSFVRAMMSLGKESLKDHLGPRLLEDLDRIYERAHERLLEDLKREQKNDQGTIV